MQGPKLVLCPILLDCVYCNLLSTCMILNGLGVTGATSPAHEQY